MQRSGHKKGEKERWKINWEILINKVAAINKNCGILFKWNNALNQRIGIDFLSFATEKYRTSAE